MSVHGSGQRAGALTVHVRSIHSSPFERSASDIDVSRWFGVTAKSGRVVGLALFSNSLRGELPRSLGSLSNLRELLLHHNQLVGEIPGSLGGLRCLETLDLSNNQFSGEMPSQLARATRLVYLNVSSNRLSGRLPDAIGHNLTRLEALHVNHNSFTGLIPESFGNLAKVEVFNASNCWLTGDLPSSLVKLTSLRVLFLGHNRLTGRLDVLAPLCFSESIHDTFPCGLRETGQLREVYANDNNFDVSDVHPCLSTSLSVLYIERNKPRTVANTSASQRTPVVSRQQRHPDVSGQLLYRNQLQSSTWSTATIQFELANVVASTEAGNLSNDGRDSQDTHNGQEDQYEATDEGGQDHDRCGR